MLARWEGCWNARGSAQRPERVINVPSELGTLTRLIFTYANTHNCSYMEALRFCLVVFFSEFSTRFKVKKWMNKRSLASLSISSIYLFCLPLQVKYCRNSATVWQPHWNVVFLEQFFWSSLKTIISIIQFFFNKNLNNLSQFRVSCRLSFLSRHLMRHWWWPTHWLEPVRC